jgi:uncharacterized cupredoxin-like copper-binding protein
MSRTRAPAAACLLVVIAGCGGGADRSAAVSAQSTAAAAGTMARPSDRRIAVRAKEYSFAPHAIAAKAGKLKITLRNNGRVEHELILLRTNRAPGSLRVEHGRVSEAASVGEISDTRAGKIASHTFKLKPGRYLMVCNVRGHYQQGMRGRLTVK